jgi:hypothetical protein
VPVTRTTLHQLRDLPRLTSLQLTLRSQHAVDHFMQGLTLDNAAAALRAILPMQLRSFRVVVGLLYNTLQEQSAAVTSSFWSALDDMTQLTEFCFVQYSTIMHTQPKLTRLPLLRTLALGPAGERGDHVDELKQLRRLRELILFDDYPDRIRLLCQPPHALRLRSLMFRSLDVDEATMRALLHLPTLTALLPGSIDPEAWVLLPGLPLLRRLRFFHFDSLTSERAASLCAALFRCSALENLELHSVSFVADKEASLSAEQQRREGWAALLSSVPNLRRLGFFGALDPLLAVLPQYLPFLDHLVLSGWTGDAEPPYARMAHPNVRLLELGKIDKRPASDEQVHACLHSEHLPKLTRCVRTDG